MIDKIKKQIRELKKDPFALAYFQFINSSSWVEQQMKTALKPYGLTHAQLNILYALAKSHPTPLSASDIKERLIVGNPDVTRLIDRLVKKGYVERKTCPSNRRKIDIAITCKGAEIYWQASNASKDPSEDFFKNLINEEEAKTLFKILKKIKP